MKRPPAKKGIAAKKGKQKQRDWRRMSLNLSVRFRNARSRVSMKETNTIGELKEEIAKSFNIPAEQQRIIVDWKEKKDDQQLLSEAGVVKKSKVIVLQKKDLVENEENSVVVVVEYNGEKFEYPMNKEEEFIDLILRFLESLRSVPAFDDIKLKQKAKVIKHEQLIKEFQHYNQNPVKVLFVERSSKKQAAAADTEATPNPQAMEAAAPKAEEVTPVSVEEKKPKVEEKKAKAEEKKVKAEKLSKKEKTPKKERVHSMSIMSFLKHAKKEEPAASGAPPLSGVPVTPVTPVVPETSETKEEKETNEAKMEVEKEEENYMDLLKREEKRSVETLLEELRKRMTEADARRQAFYREAKKRRSVIIVSKEEKVDQVPVKEEKVDQVPVKEEAKSDEDEEAVIEVVNEFEEVKDEATIEDVTPQLFTNAVVPTKHVLLTINKNGLSPAELLELPRLLGFRYIHPDTDTDAKRVFFGISHAASEVVTGRTPLARDERVNYEDDSEDEEDEDDDIQGDDCNDTESEESEVETANRLDYGDGFLAEEDINIGDANLSAEEKSALVFRSVSGNKGKLNEEIKLSNQPFVLRPSEGVVMGVDLRACRCVISDPVFFSGVVATIKKKKLEVEKKPEEGVESAIAETGRRKVNMNDAVAKELAALIQGQSLTISQINDKMQEKYPGLPKRQIELKLHEIAEKKHRMWILRPTPVPLQMVTLQPQVASLQSQANPSSQVHPFQSQVHSPQPPVDIESVMATHAAKREHEEERKREFPERVVIGESMHGEDSNAGAKRARIQTEKIPDGTILIGNISHSAFAVDPNESGPSSFTGVV